jgi:hypothetical protein
MGVPTAIVGRQRPVARSRRRSTVTPLCLPEILVLASEKTRIYASVNTSRTRSRKERQWQ